MSENDSTEKVSVFTDENNQKCLPSEKLNCPRVVIWYGHFFHTLMQYGGFAMVTPLP